MLLHLIIIIIIITIINNQLLLFISHTFKVNIIKAMNDEKNKSTLEKIHRLGTFINPNSFLHLDHKGIVYLLK